ncbi:capsid protein [Tortoise genomovirus 23]|nr:capsid protein [Tortoise genomovirus 23]
MAYRTVRRGRRSYTRKATRPTRKGYGGTRRRRSYPTTRRRYSKKMSSKRILNMVSRKKRDSMMSYSNVTTLNPVNGQTYTAGPAVLRGDQTYMFAWIPTARDLSYSNNTANSIINESQRTSTTCYMRGLKEAMNVRTNSGAAWQWRRICFTNKGDDFVGINDIGSNYYTETSNGMVRTMNNINTKSSSTALIDRLFRGTQNKDWLNLFNAPLENRNFKIWYDRTISIASGNEQGLVRTYKHWFPMNKNLVYDDDENGENIKQSFLSTTGKPGMGDYYIVDFFQPSDGQDQSDTLALLPEATLYWHEK